MLTRHQLTLTLAAVVLVGVVVLASFGLGRALNPDAAETTPAAPAEVTTTTDPVTGQPPRTLDDLDHTLATYTPTTTIDATPEQRALAEIDTAVRGFIDGWTLDAPTEQRQAALEPFMSTPTMAQAYALADASDTPNGVLWGPPIISHRAGDDTGSAFVQFTKPTGLSLTIDVVHIDAGWRVLMIADPDR